LKDSVGRDGVFAALAQVRQRVSAAVWSEDAVFFFEWSGTAPPDPGGARLEPLDLDHLAAATARYADDPSTLAYLLRSAARFQEENAEGFGLIDANGAVLHFAWVTAFDGFFLAELNTKIDAPSADCVMLFDCWTPVLARGHGYYGRTVSLIAKQMQAKCKKPWIFSAASNLASVRGLEKTGFQRGYVLVRKRILGWQRIKREPPRLDGAVVPEVAARV
jgi:hypothetical protein